MKRLYNAACAWLEASAKAMSEEAEPEPEGAGAAQVEHAHSYSTPPEMHAGHERRHIDDTEDRKPRVGFQKAER